MLYNANANEDCMQMKTAQLHHLSAHKSGECCQVPFPGMRQENFQSFSPQCFICSERLSRELVEVFYFQYRLIFQWIHTYANMNFGVI